MIVSHNELSVHKDVSGENQSTKAAIDELGCAGVREKRSDEAEQDQRPQSSKQVRHPRGEIILGLACEECEAHKDTRCEENRLQNNPTVEERYDNGH